MSIYWQRNRIPLEAASLMALSPRMMYKNYCSFVLSIQRRKKREFYSKQMSISHLKRIAATGLQSGQEWETQPRSIW